jgi:hypothetical protein
MLAVAAVRLLFDNPGLQLRGLHSRLVQANMFYGRTFGEGDEMLDQTQPGAGADLDDQARMTCARRRP